MLAEVKRVWYVNDVVDFVKRFGLEKEFKKRFGKDIDEWDFEMSDDEVIEQFLEEWKGIYFLTYNEYWDRIEIFELKVNGDKSG